MRHRRPRLLAALLCAALVGMVVPGAAVSASPTPATTQTATAKEAVVKTAPTPHGIRVDVLDLPRSVTGLDFYRSEAPGVEGTKLNATPVGENAYADDAARPDTEYYYTVKVASRNADAEPSRFTCPDVFPQTAAVSFSAKHEARPDGVTTTAKAPMALKRTAVARPARTVRPAINVGPLHTIGGSGVATLTAANTVWSPAAGAYYVKNDVIVPAGKTLTIMPGTKIYFDTAYSGNGSSHTKGNPTEKIDIVVHGILIAKGTAAAPILMTSIQANPANSTSLPYDGDWGSIFCDSKKPSEISRCRIEWGSGLWSFNTARPYILNNQITRCSYPGAIGMETGWSGSILFERAKTDAVTPQVRIERNTIVTYDEGIMCFSSTASDGGDGKKYTGPMTVNPRIAYNAIFASGYAIDLETWTGSSLNTTEQGPCTTRGDVVGNIVTGDSEESIYLYAATYDKWPAVINTAFTRNVVSNPDDYGVYSYTDAYGYGVSDNRPTFVGDRISSYEDGFEGSAYSYDSTETAGGTVAVRPTFTGCTLVSSDYNAFYGDADSANHGAALVEPVFTDSRIENYSGYGMELDAGSDHGMASTSPTLDGCTGISYCSDDFMDSDVTAFDDELAKANPRIIDSWIYCSDSTVLYLYATSYYGDAQTKPYVSGSTLSSYEYCIEAYAYASNQSSGHGEADASGKLLNSKLLGDDYTCYYVDASADGTGGAAFASPLLDHSVVQAPYSEDGMELYAAADDGPAIVSPTLRNGSLVSAYDYGIYAEADRNPDDYSIDNDAVVSPVFSHSTVRSADSETLYMEVDNYGKGDSLSKPRFHASTIQNTYDDGAVYAEVDKSAAYDGTAEFSPVADTSRFISTGDYDVEANVDGPHTNTLQVSNAKVGGSFTGCTFDSSENDGYYVDIDNGGGSGRFTTSLTDCKGLTVDDYAIYADVNSYGRGDQPCVASPRISGGDYNLANDGFYFEASWGSQYSLPAAAAVASTGTYECGPQIRNTSVQGNCNHSVETYVFSPGAGGAVNNTYVYDSKLLGYDPFTNFAGARWGGGDAVNNASIVGASARSRSKVEGVQSYGIENETYAWDGDAVDRTKVKYTDIDANDEAIYDTSNSQSAVSTVTCSPTIYGNRIGTKWAADDDGIAIYGYAARDMDGAPNVSRNAIGPVAGNGIYMSLDMHGEASIDPMIAYNRIGTGSAGVDGYGFEINEDGDFGPNSKVTVLGNVIEHSANSGVYLSSCQYGLVQANKINYAGWDQDSLSTGSGIYWDGAEETSPTGALVKGNLVRNSKLAVYYNNGWAGTAWNSFADITGANNRPYNLYTSKSVAYPGEPRLDARHNWWGSVATPTIASTILSAYGTPIEDVVDYGAPITSVAPRCTSITRTVSGSTITFKVRFDRPMDTSITKLRFGASAPYATFSATGTWNSSGKEWTGHFSPAGALTPGTHYYFSGARDLPGTLMVPTSKYFNL